MSSWAFGLQTITHTLLATTFQSIFGVEIKILTCFNLSLQVVFTTRAKSGTVLLTCAPMIFSLRLVSCLVEHNKRNQTHPYCNIFWWHNQCRRGQCLPNCVQVVLCAYVVIHTKIVEIITEMKTIHHSNYPSPLEPSN